MAWVKGMISRLLKDDLSYAERRDILYGLDAMVVVWPDGHMPRWTLLFGWRGYLLERMSNPETVPLPVNYELLQHEAATDILAPVTRLTLEVLWGNEAATQESMPSPEEMAKRMTAAWRKAKAVLRPDPEQLRADLAPAVDWATHWLFRPKGGRTIEGSTRHNTRIYA